MKKISYLAVCIVLAGLTLVTWLSTTQNVTGAQLPTFTLSAEPASKVIPWWDYDFNYTISISPTNLPYSVTLSATAVYDVMARFSPRYLIPAISSTLTVDPCASIFVPFETWITVTVIGVGGGYTQTVDVSFIQTIPRHHLYLPLIFKP